MQRVIIFLILCLAATLGLSYSCISITEHVAAQTRRHKRAIKSPKISPQAPGGTASKYSAFLHSSDKHKGLECNACHKVPTAWTAKRDFPDAADFPDHDACVRCHRQQFFGRQAFVATGPAICTVCHVRAAPREDGRFVFGRPNGASQPMKPKDERQFMIEFPHDKHQNVIAWFRSNRDRMFYALADARVTTSITGARFVRASFAPAQDEKRADYNNCTICHIQNNTASPVLTDSFTPPAGTFKTMPHAHDACFACHWKNEKPTSDDCAGCHKPSASFVALNWPGRKSVKFSHEGAKGNHLAECTTCHINITRASSLQGLTPDVPVTACATCHKDNKKITYPNIVTIEMQLDEFKKTGDCSYCHTSDVGKKKAPQSHIAAAQ